MRGTQGVPIACSKRLWMPIARAVSWSAAVARIAAALIGLPGAAERVLVERMADALLKILQEGFGHTACGVYARVIRGGRIAKGDVVTTPPS